MKKFCCVLGISSVLFATATLSAFAFTQFGCYMETSNRWGIARSPDSGTKKATTFDYYGSGDGYGCAILLRNDSSILITECADSYNRTVSAEKTYDDAHKHAHSGGMLP